jgi:short-subunit dehydrogenase
MLKFRTMKSILLTGTSSELGKAIMDTLSQEGYEVIPLKVDITDDASCRQAIKKIANQKIFALINVAGVNKYGESLSFSPQEFMDLLNVNAVGQFRLLKTLHDQNMLPNRVVNITSLNSILAWPKFALYCATKFAADGLGMALRYELSPRVQITNIAPGAIYRPGAKA